MSLWPFRRKSRRKSGRASVTETDEERGRTTGVGLPHSQSAPDTTITSHPAALGRKASKKQRTEPNKLQRRPRTYSFSPGRQDAIEVGRKTSPQTKGNVRAQTMDDELTRRVPTLHGKREGDNLHRKKSSKRRRRDDQREAEIKAMSAFVPLRPATEDWMAGRPIKKDSKRVRNGIGFSLRGTHWDKFNRSSDISLPAAESIHSSLSSDSEYISFKVSALEALAPRPTLRCAVHPRAGSGPLDGAGRQPQPQKKLSGPIPEATLKAHKRIANLADDLSASDLRELMERDQRRRERKRQRDQERIEQRLARRAEKQRAAEAEAKRQGRDSPPNLERGVLGREAIGLGVDPTSAVITSSKIRQSADDQHHQTQQVEHLENVAGDAMDEDPRPHPLAAFHRTDSIPLATPVPPAAAAELSDEKVPPLVSPRSRSSFLRTNFSRSKSPQASESKTERSDPSAKRASISGSPKGPLSWSSIFRWARHRRSASAEPSSFSNTSRDSVQAPPASTQQHPANIATRRVSAGVPKRTMSRFREDLPELPLTPPRSRIQSPEAEAVPAAVTDTGPDMRGGLGVTASIASAMETSDDAPASEPRDTEAMRHTPSTLSHPDEPGVSPEPQSMSLASIDSEASWFSGRMSKKRKSSGMLPSSYSQLHRQTPESDSERTQEQDTNNDAMSIVEDDYLSRFARSNSERAGLNRKSTGEARPSSDWEEEAPHWGSVRGQQPTVVHSHTADRMKSREGLLKTFMEDAEQPVAEDDNSPVDDGQGVQRATSINLGKPHARHISAGSARLLSISPRSSVDARRMSLTPRSQSP